MSNVTFKATHRRQAMLLWATLIVFVLLALVGCGTSETDSPGDDGMTEDMVDRHHVEVDGTNPEVGFITVNGVHCIVMDGYENGGITCDWEGSR